MEKDLFGNIINDKKSRTRLEYSLLRYDQESFANRLERLKYLNKITPKNVIFGADPESIYVYDEVKMNFINGEFISTILLSQAFIEKRLQNYYESIGFANISRRGLKAILKHAKENKVFNEFLIDKIDQLRKKRNPFTHLKPFDYEYTISQRIIGEISKHGNFKQPIELLEKDAKDAISLMFTMLMTDLKCIPNST